MSRTGARVALVAGLILAAGCAGAAPRVPSAATASATPAAAVADTARTQPVHPSRMPDLSLAGPYPRFTAAQLVASGYPDHMHAFFWPGWRPPVGEDGQPFGPGSLCTGGQLAVRPGLVVKPGRIAWDAFTLASAAEYEPCELMPFVELCDFARRRAHDLLGLRADGVLHLVSADSLKGYQAATGYGSWRLYQLRGDTCRVEPIPVLFARTLAGHAAVELTTLWTLERTTGDRLPPWLRQGLAGYLADMGPHFLSFVGMYRQAGRVTLPPAEIDRLLTSPPAVDPAADQQFWRRAGYSAFVMAWRLVEGNGGLGPLRDALSRVAKGATWADACREDYGATPAQLAARLDPTLGPEPVGRAVQPRQPQVPPAEGGP